MLRDAPTPAAAEPDLRPITKRFPTQFRRGYYAFKEGPPPPPVITDLPSRWPVLRDVVALRFRLAGELVPHRVQTAADQGELEAFPKVNMQGALMDLQLVDGLFYFALKQNTGTPRTGTSVLVRAMAEGRNWPMTKQVASPADPDAVVTVERSDSELIDSYKGRIDDAKWRCVQMGLLGRVRIAWDDNDNERGTDWELLGVPEISEEEYAAADAAIDAYLRRNPTEAARALSARLRGQHFRHFKRRIRQRLTKPVYDRKTQTAPLPAASGPPGRNNPNTSTETESSYRAGASNPEELTRLPATIASEPKPRMKPNADRISEGAGADLRRSPAAKAPASGQQALAGWRDDQQRADVGTGRYVALSVADELDWRDHDRSAISAKAADKLGRLTRRARKLLGLSPEQVAEALTRIMAERRCHLGEAIRLMKRDLKRHPSSPAAAKSDVRRAVADQRRAADLAKTPIPDFVRLDAGGRPRVWVDAEGGGQPHIACSALPHDLSDPEIRKAIHAAAHAARITGPQRVAQAAVAPHSPLDPRLFTLDERLEATERLRGNGCVRLIALTGEMAIVPPEHSTAAAVRWSIERTPSPEQIETYRMLLKRRGRRSGVTNVARISTSLGGHQGTQEPATFVEMWWAIDALLAELAPHAHQPDRDPGPAEPAARDWQPPATSALADRETIDHGLQLIADHGTITAAIMATHPDHGGNPDDLQAVLAARAHFTGSSS